MKNFTLKTIIGLSTAAVAMVTSSSLRADWEQIHSLPTTYAHFITSEGVHLMSDYNRNKDGGIYYSEDRGSTWTKSEVRDYWFSDFYEADGYVFALGASCRIGRSEDGGRTWDLLNYSKTVEEWIPKGAIDETVCYGMTVLDGVLYAADFAGGGVICSYDYGETWEMTDRDSLYIYFSDDPNPEMDSFYRLQAFKGKVYAFGLYSVHAYVPEDKKWLTIPINSNCMGSVTVFGDTMICGRAVMNYYKNIEYLLACDGGNWTAINRPDTDDNNVRCLDNDGTYLYSLHHGGPMYYTADMGETWNVTGGFPEGLYPLTLSYDDEYVYSGVYSPVATETKSGLWRFPKSELKGSGIETPKVDDVFVTRFDGRSIICREMAKSVSVMLPNGKEVMTVNNTYVADLSQLPGGIYLYSVDYGTCQRNGKIIKQ